MLQAQQILGKIDRKMFDRLIYPRLGAKDPRVLVGPMHGVDTGIVEIGGQVVASTSDPVFIVPEYGMERAAWFAIHILVSDVVTSGLKPAFLSIDLSRPPRMTDEELTTVWSIIHRECEKMGIAIVSGHTGRYENCDYPMVGGATVLAVGGKEEFVGPQFIKEGDAVIITKGPAIEACGILGTMFPEIIEEKLGERVRQQAAEMFWKMSVVDDAQCAVSIGVRDKGVSAMHDATECGIWGGLVEMAHASGFGMRIEKEKIVVEPGVKEISGLFGFDPYPAISEGTLLLTVRPDHARDVLSVFGKNNISASAVGTVTGKGAPVMLIEGGREKKLEHPGVDPFWPAFYKALENRGV